MTRVDIALAGSLKQAQPLRACQSKRCAGAERTPEGGCQVSSSKWICASCWGVHSRRMFR